MVMLFLADQWLVATPAYGLLGLRPSFRLRFISENVTLLCVCSTTYGPTSLSC